MRIVFIGGPTNGKIVYDYLNHNKFVDLVKVYTYPDNIEKPRDVYFPNNKLIIKILNVNQYLNEIKNLNPDLIFVAGWSELLSKELINIPHKGTIGFHPSKLPYDRGRSVIAWQIEEGYTETALTMFYYNELPDLGNIIAQELIKIEFNDYVNDVLQKIDSATYNLLRAYFRLIREGNVPRIKQDINEGNYRRLRKEKDSWIDWNQNSINIYNKVRAISKPYPGALALVNDVKYKIWKSEILDDFNYGRELSAGSLIAMLHDKSFIVKTKDSFLRVIDYEKE